MKLAASLLLLLLCTGCAYRPLSKEWREEYCYLKKAAKPAPFIPEGELLILSVDAPRFDTSSAGRFLRTLVKHPATGSMEGHFGHAWITLFRNGKTISCGHSGERDPEKPRYLDAVMDLAESGDPNPARALFEEREDGYLEWGSGGHSATYSILLSITSEEADQIESLIRRGPEAFCRYSLQKHQCVSFLQDAARIAGIDLDAEVEILLPSQIELGGEILILWSDPCYQTFSFLSPDRLERAMDELVAEGRAKRVVWGRGRHALGFSIERWVRCHSLQALP